MMGNYDEFAQEYAKLTEQMEIQTRKHYRNILPTSLEQKRVLDVGCGSGQDATYFTDNGAIFYGLDISEKEIELAKKTKQGNFLVGNMNSLPYETNLFDVVSSVYALQASENVTKSILEMIRVAKSESSINILTKHPTRQLIEGHINDGEGNYFAEKRRATSHIFDGEITLNEPAHTMQEYFAPQILEKANLTLFEEHSDFPASAQVIEGMTYPTYMILQYTKK